jgi:hypothetical protein
MNKLRKLFVVCGGDLIALQNDSPIDKMFTNGEDSGSFVKSKFKTRGNNYEPNLLWLSDDNLKSTTSITLLKSPHRHLEREEINPHKRRHP